MRTAILATLLVATAGCGRTINQHAQSGPDARYGGARPIVLEGGTGEASGIVTYPGGDRVDWKTIELPADQKGALAIDLSWKAPRPGLDLSFEVWDQWGTKLARVSPKRWPTSGRRARNARLHKETSVTGVRGTVYVLVFASNRGDAGRYKLNVTFTPEVTKELVGYDEKLQELLAGGLKIPDPPKLAMIYPRCGDEYDPSNPDCVDDPPVCNRDKPDKKNPSCKHLCDKDKLDPKNPDCKQFYAACDPKAWDVGNPNCQGVTPWTEPPPDPIFALVLEPAIKDGKTQIQFAIAKDSPIAAGWEGDIVDKNKKVVAKGHFQVLRVQKSKGLAFGVVELSLDEVNRNPQVLVYPPAKP